MPTAASFTERPTRLVRWRHVLAARVKVLYIKRPALYDAARRIRSRLRRWWGQPSIAAGIFRWPHDFHVRCFMSEILAAGRTIVRHVISALARERRLRQDE